MKILIIEDEPELRETIQKFLLGERYVVETAATMNEGLDKVLVYDYDCILLDIMLPDGNGLTLLKTPLRENTSSMPLFSSTS